jgi:hypothetical protein
VAAGIMCRPSAAIDRSAGGLQRHPIVVVVVCCNRRVWVEHELDRTNESLGMQGFRWRDAMPT